MSRTPIIEAAKARNIAMIEWLLENTNADVNATDDVRSSAYRRKAVVKGCERAHGQSSA